MNKDDFEPLNLFFHFWQYVANGELIYRACVYCGNLDRIDHSGGKIRWRNLIVMNPNCALPPDEFHEPPDAEHISN